MIMEWQKPFKNLYLMRHRMEERDSLLKDNRKKMVVINEKKNGYPFVISIPHSGT